jgi:NAD(P)-dependent dehydrogenase (short-subunit alcohol dehydrogenase family)
MELDGKVALVTGAGSGIGAASAKVLAANGARVAVLDVNAERAVTITHEIEAAGGAAFSLAADVSDEGQMRRAIGELIETAGRVDIVVANAGINGYWAPIDEITTDEWDRTVNVNLRGTYLTIHLTVPHLKSGGGGSIVIMSSINGTRTFTTAGATAYVAAKAAQAAMANQLSLELGMHRIRVNAVCPGSTRTDIGQNTFKRNVEAARFPVQFPQGDVPITGGKPAAAEDIADAVYFLCSDHSKHVNGTWLFVDGGQSHLR